MPPRLFAAGQAPPRALWFKDKDRGREAGRRGGGGGGPLQARWRPSSALDLKGPPSPPGEPCGSVATRGTPRGSPPGCPARQPASSVAAGTAAGAAPSPCGAASDGEMPRPPVGIAPRGSPGRRGGPGRGRAGRGGPGRGPVPPTHTTTTTAATKTPKSCSWANVICHPQLYQPHGCAPSEPSPAAPRGRPAARRGGAPLLLHL